tara:strand:- start:5427 stop:5669 length:243 start_codon:yes stop_codon:yes gene_type:complete
MNNWSTKAKDLSKELHHEISIKETYWHQYKNNHSRRAAELISASLIQLISEKDINNVEELLVQSLKWIRGEIEFQKCSHK